MSSYVTIKLPTGPSITVPLSAIGATSDDAKMNVDAISQLTVKVGILAMRLLLRHVSVIGANAGQLLKDIAVSAEEDFNGNIDLSDATSKTDPKIGSITAFYVETPSGEKFTTLVKTDDTVKAIKGSFCRKQGILPDQHCFVLAGERLSEKETIKMVSFAFLAGSILFAIY